MKGSVFWGMAAAAGHGAGLDVVFDVSCRLLCLHGCIGKCNFSDHVGKEKLGSGEEKGNTSHRFYLLVSATNHNRSSLIDTHDSAQMDGDFERSMQGGVCATWWCLIWVSFLVSGACNFNPRKSCQDFINLISFNVSLEQGR